MSDNEQLDLIIIGMLMGRKLPNLNINDLKSLEQLRIYLNYELDTDIQKGMLFVDVIKELNNDCTGI